MTKSITLMLGGTQGEGIVSTGNILIRALSRAGYYTYGCRTFSSRIKGGHTNYRIDIHTDKIFSTKDQLDILVAFDQDSIELNYANLKKNGLLIYDDIITVKDLISDASQEDIHIFSAPLTGIAKKYGSTLMKNSATVGLLGKLLQLPISYLEEIICTIFKKKGTEIIEKNLSILKEAYAVHLGNASKFTAYHLPNIAHSRNRASMLGNEAIALGALAAGCRFMSAYPITPASEIMEYLTKKFPSYGGAMVQTEDEISAVTMAIGASYAGCRSMTATSGPGISLMMEGIGLAGMGEIPLVIVDVQRGGPSTGLPTKHEQSDIHSLYYGPHGEISSIILAPYTVEECFYQTIKAFHFADQYQCPVFILSDLMLGLSRQTIDDLDKSTILIDRGAMTSDHDLNGIKEAFFKRFRFTEQGISPRSIPGQPFGIHHVTGIEHVEEGKPSEESVNRKRMMDKRLNKVASLKAKDGIALFGTLDSPFLILTIGSNYGLTKRAIEEHQYPVAYGVFQRIKPFPETQMKRLVEKYDKILVIENNATAQLASIIKQEAGCHHKIFSLLKYDGNPFTLKEIKSSIEELI
ncbi:2-oxoacid:acceptor oxidoreductase subunit alpha [Clostridiaceae bacterium 35-E11]